MIYLLEHATALLALGAAAWVSGRVLLPSSMSGPHASLAAFCLGIGYWSSTTFLLAATGLLNRGGLVAGTAALVVVAAARRVFLRQAWSRAAQAAVPRPSFASLAACLVLTAVLLPLLALNVSPPVSWDAAVYHLTLPKLYLAEGGFRPVEMSVYSNWPLQVQLLYAVAMLLHGYTLAKAVHFGFALLVVYAFFAACRSRRRPLPWATPWLATAFFLANGVVLFELRTAYVDLAHAFFFFSAFLFMEQAALSKGRDGANALLVAGLACGLLASVKVSGILGVPVIAALYLPRLRTEAAAGRAAPAAERAAAGGFLVRFALPVAALWVPWLVKAAWYTGNPFYPFLHAWFGGPDWNEELAGHLSAWQWEIGMGRGVLDYLLLPLRVILLGGRGYDRFDGEIGLFWIVLVPLALFGARTSGTVRRALAVAGLYFLVWAATSQQMRFLIPILPLLALAAATAVVDLVERLRQPSWRRVGHGFALAGALALVASAAAPGLTDGVRTVAAFSGIEGDVRESVVPPHLRFVNEHLPADARLLFLNTNLGFFCDREYLADSFFEASQIAAYLAEARTGEEVYRRLRERGITHVVLDRRQRPRRNDLPGVLGQMLRERTSVLYRSADGRFDVRELR